MSDNAAGSKPIDRWIPWFFVLFFVVIAVLDGIFVTLALTTHTGTVTDNPYEKGLVYSRTLEEAAQQADLGWQVEINLGPGNEITAQLKDREGRPLAGASVLAKVTRPVQDGSDFEIALPERNKGDYGAVAGFPFPGQWKVRVFVTWQDTHYQSSRMIMVP